MTEPTPFPLPDRFWDKTRRDDNGCLIWTACLNGKGYGCFSLAGTIQLAHRVAYLAAGGVIPDGWHVDHLCRVRACVEATHLEAVTPAVNNRRMADALLAEGGGLRYTTVTHNYRDRQGFDVSSTHIDRAYMRQRCPYCPDKAA